VAYFEPKEQVEWLDRAEANSSSSMAGAALSVRKSDGKYWPQSNFDPGAKDSSLRFGFGSWCDWAFGPEFKGPF